MLAVTPAAPKPGRIRLALQAARELGLRPLADLALYRFGLKTGHYRRVTSPRLAQRLAAGIRSKNYTQLWNVPSQEVLTAAIDAEGQEWLLAEAGRILDGRVTLFGALDAPLRLVTSAPLVSWTAYEGGVLAAPGRPEEDIKLVWEPARFGWAFTLGRAYRLTGDERYPEAFWQRLDEFLAGSPPYLGPHWASAQEVALRLMAFTFALQIFQVSPSSTPQRVLRLLQAVAVHAGRIPPTLPYARAQNNNHLLSEAAGLITAGLLLPEHPNAKNWRAAGWKWLNYGLQAQIADDGAYSQHSANYHRLMLQLGLWADHLADVSADLKQPGGLEPESRTKLAAATRWLAALLDPVSGRVPNLGPNDGAYIFPLTARPFEDYRPVLQAAARRFPTGEPHGCEPCADEMCLWLCSEQPGDTCNAPGLVALHVPPAAPDATPHVLRSPDGDSWAYLRAARFTGRPGHADQLHLDLWWRGLNVAMDAGTYLYNAAPPWDNALARAEVHNTVTIDGQDQMTRAGKFLYVDRAQADEFFRNRAEDGTWELVRARHNGYNRLGFWHDRSAKYYSSLGWEVVDQIYPVKPSSRVYTASLHWLLPDWPWNIETGPDLWDIDLELNTPQGRVRLHMDQNPADPQGPCSRQLQIARAGELAYGSGSVSPIWGWYSPTYGVKVPALSIRFSITGMGLIRFSTEFDFPLNPTTNH